MQNIFYKCEIKHGKSFSLPILSVNPPFEVLFDLMNIPDLDSVIEGIKVVIAGQEKVVTYGWHRCTCQSEAETTWVTDEHAEIMGTVAHLKVSTLEVLRMLEDYWAFKQDYYGRS